MAIKTTNAARISALEEQVATLFEVSERNLDMLKAIADKLENLAPASQAKQPKAKKSSTKKTSSKKATKKSKTEIVNPGIHYETKAAKNGNGEVIWLKFDKPCNNEQYCLLKALDPKTFKPLKNKKSLWTWSKTMKAYHAIKSEKALKQVAWFEKNYIPATDEELAIRKAAFTKAA